MVNPRVIAEKAEEEEDGTNIHRLTSRAKTKIKKKTNKQLVNSLAG